MKRLTHHLSASILTVIFSLIASGGFGQPPAPPPPPPAGSAGTPCWDSTCIPIDSGIVLLIIVALILGTRMILKLKSNLKSES
ncbi:hypothetical protein K6119_09025 [Paracrocinitomix mangrovi]|uniref:hypothetical protein n=1 Tax=Paracrocinitomix mangrovi TaxID=2862509 RepID=UPI001C8D8380|nr:hypothetical protein [Paracrocinitomix mangrovi]UKN03654.1 hypothetical protein K6119_09025 [Paracrocinitomix mangrovi]